jgi:hypothetical protein
LRWRQCWVYLAHIGTERVVAVLERETATWESALVLSVPTRLCCVPTGTSSLALPPFPRYVWRNHKGGKASWEPAITEAAHGDVTCSCNVRFSFFPLSFPLSFPLYRTLQDSTGLCCKPITLQWQELKQIKWRFVLLFIFFDPVTNGQTAETRLEK